jgi:hypothetical protein
MTTMHDALQIKAEMEHGWLALPGVTGVDVGRRRADGEGADTPVIRIFVADRRASERLALPESVRGVPVEIVERRFELH